VRIRQKGSNQYVYSEASYAKPLFHLINEAVRQNAYQSVLDPSTGQPVPGLPMGLGGQSPSERDRVQNQLFRYREEKIQREIERIDMERRKAQVDKLRSREEQARLRSYNE
jgi:hypothetical protein